MRKRLKSEVEEERDRGQERDSHTLSLCLEHYLFLPSSPCNAFDLMTHHYNNSVERRGVGALSSLSSHWSFLKLTCCEGFCTRFEFEA
ncbi:hypothetical protein VNO77_02128 [Canavalia gladiata]|uniref:Uncharacterized protein n=1 Tax=Canavalia gladiata TaxID=3824 RepID=A0AAN9MSM8_CANGL